MAMRRRVAKRKQRPDADPKAAAWPQARERRPVAHAEPSSPCAAPTFAQQYRERFSEYHLAWSVFFVAHLADLRRQLGDLDDALLLTAFGIGPVADKLRAAKASGNAADLRYGGAATSDGMTNASRLAEMTGIPRETVRRKLAAFERRGWIAQAEDGAWQISVGADGVAMVACDLEAANLQFLEHLARFVGELDRIRNRSGL
jgi:hypothetical protein